MTFSSNTTSVQGAASHSRNFLMETGKKSSLVLHISDLTVLSQQNLVFYQICPFKNSRCLLEIKSFTVRKKPAHDSKFRGTFGVQSLAILCSSGCAAAHPTVLTSAVVPLKCVYMHARACAHTCVLQPFLNKSPH